MKRKFRFKDAAEPFRGIVQADQNVLEKSANEYMKRGIEREEAESKAVDDMIAMRQLELNKFTTAAVAAFQKDYPSEVTAEAAPEVAAKPAEAPPPSKPEKVAEPEKKTAAETERRSFAGGMSQSSLQSHIDTLQAKWKGGPTIKVIAREDAPFATSFDAQGAFHNGTVYLFHDYIPNKYIGEMTVLHEVLGHFGLRGVLKGRMVPVMNMIYRGNEWIANAADNWAADEINQAKRGDMNDAEWRALATEEALSDVAASETLQSKLSELNGWDKLVAAVRNFLRSIGFVHTMSDKDIASLLASSRSFVENGGSQFNGKLSPAFSKGADQTKTQNFREWFGNSKVVDSNGKPLRVYHGTVADVTAFDLLRFGENTKHSSSSLGIFFSESPDIANMFAGETLALKGRSIEANHKPGANVVPVYLNIRNPLKITADEFQQRFMLDGESAALFQQQAIKNGHDGIVILGDKENPDGLRGNEFDADSYVAFNPEQVKSATGNNGAFDKTNPSIVESRANQSGIFDNETNKPSPSASIFEHLTSAESAKDFGNRAFELFDSDATFNRLTKNLNTQFHKAKVDPKYFGPVFNAVQTQMNDTSHYATEAEKLAPGVLIRLEDGTLWDSIKSIGGALTMQGRFKNYKTDMAEIAKPLFANIEGERSIKQKVFTDEELKTEWKLDARQIGLYHQYRAAASQSIERLAHSQILGITQSLGMDITPFKNMGLNESAKTIRDMIAANKTEDAAQKERLLTIGQEIETIQENARDLIASGYTPAMRFGEYQIRGTIEGKPYVGFFESQMQANAMLRSLKEAYPQDTFEKSKMNPDEYKMFKGVSLDTMALVAQLTGKKTDAVREYIALVKSSQSAEKRLLKRKGIAGFSQDASRVLASFITSNARASSQATNGQKINEAYGAIPSSQGASQKEAQDLISYIANPNEEASKLRGLLFMHYLGGSVSAGLVNLTQPVLQTAPFLSQYLSAFETANVMRAAATSVARGKIDPKFKFAFDKAGAEGITEPHEVFQLMADASGSALGKSLRARAFVKAWGSFFSMSEAFNRKVTFLAALDTAQKMGAQKFAKTGFKNAYDFAANAIIETQGLYNKGNRPNWARGTGGAILFTFKQFSISYLEWFSRLPHKQKLIALAFLLLAAGFEGLPFAEDLEDLIDTIGHRLGYATNSRKSLKNLIAEELGPDMAEVLIHGSSRLTGLDLSGRLGMGNLIPGTAFFDPANQNKSRDVLEAAGAAGGFLKGVSGAMDGDVAGALPTAIKNVAKAYQMASTGEYKDMKNKTVIKVDGWDAAMKSVGFQPTNVAEDSKRIKIAQDDKDIYQFAKKEIVDKWVQGIVDQKPELVKEAMADRDNWNLKNPTMRVQVIAPDIIRKVKESKMTSAERAVKHAPKVIRQEIRADVR